jgi:hypothetical protein
MKYLTILFLSYCFVASAHDNIPTEERPNSCYCSKTMVNNSWWKQITYKIFMDSGHYLLKVEYFPPNTSMEDLDQSCENDIAQLHEMKICQI